MTLRPWLVVLGLAVACASPPPPAAPSTPEAASAPPTPTQSPAQQERAGHEEHPPGPLVHRFDENPEKWAQRFERPERKAKQKPDEVVAAMKIAPGMEVADIGTGTGYFLPYLSPAVGEHGRVYALDIEPKMIEYVKKRCQREGLANVEAKVVEVDDPLLRDGSLDRILIVDTWHHIPEREKYSAKLAKGLKPGGQVWVIDYKMESADGPPTEHRITPGQVETELRAGGLSPRTDSTMLPDQYIVVGSKR